MLKSIFGILINLSSSTMSKLSIITINLNNALGLERTINSVLEQDFIDYEFIIIDGGSTDGSLEIIKEYDSQITHWISEPDNGIYNAMNKGIKLAKGEYCYFLNSADWIYKATTISNILNKNPSSDIVLCNILFMVGGKEELRTGIGKNFFTFKDIFDHWCHQSLLIKRSLFNSYGLYNEMYKITADWVFLLKVLALGEATFEYIPEIIAYYDNNGISSQNTDWYSEKKHAMKEMIPPKILDDYFSKNYNRFQRILSHQLSFFIFVNLNRLVILWQIVLGTNNKKRFH